MMVQEAKRTLTKNAGDDWDVILKVIAGERDAYREIVTRYEGRVRRYCLGALCDPTQAEDAAQEVFIKAYQALERFRGDSTFSTWLYRIAVNHCKDILRKKARAKTQSWEALLENEGEKIEHLLVAPQPVRIGTEQMELISRVLSHLPEKSRTLLLLREMHDLSYEALAEVLECSVDSVKSRLKRARQEIEKKLRHLVRPRTSNRQR